MQATDLKKKKKDKRREKRLVEFKEAFHPNPIT